ncbi:MAG: class I tRNA ligase family protein [Patescibacteria group bacterium]|nr:class I tRNA ligase family protein [Patescibacteria group bacterium]
MTEPAADGEKSDVAKREEEILAFWKEQGIFEKSVAKDAPKGEFVFYDGPPFATGTPHSGSLLSSVSKDVIPRYKTMRGYRVRRRWGWDTHGLPIESLVEKKLGLKNKREILDIGIEKFNETARSMVLGYVADWKRYVERVGRWIDFDNSYKTMDASYTESVWWALKKIHEKGRLYEGRKVLMYCPHCETPLAKAEIAMDNTYQDITEDAVTVKFKLKHPVKHGFPANTYILAWTTTPWTLPGNVALAVGKHIDYFLFTDGREHFIAAKELMPEHAPHAVKNMTGADLVGLEYEPLYEIEKVKRDPSKKKWTVLPADFVTTTDGTGIVHTAVIYGEDDYQLGVAHDLPMVPLLSANATYTEDAPEFLRGQYIRKASPMIMADLEERGLLYKKAPHTHSYPHCYRCGTPLIYNAVSSWFIDMQKVKPLLLAENEKINWFPAFLKHGRFKNIIETAPDWTISRNRFWASPLPIWKDTDGHSRVIGSLDELKSFAKKSGNRYFVMRHGEAEYNARGMLHSDQSVPDPLTEKGKADVRAVAEKLKGNFIDIIIASPYERTEETAAIVADVIGYDRLNIIVDERLREVAHGDGYTGRANDEYDKDWNRVVDTFAEAPKGGESFAAVKRRMGEFFYDIESRYAGKNILIVSHGHPLSLLESAAAGRSRAAAFAALHASDYLVPAEARELPFTPLPHNRDYELDYHLPYIDELRLEDEKGRPLTRIPEVVDCWVESGAMPFAEYHYPFENRSEFEHRAPGDFVSEYIGQTRAWFYYMHAMSVQLFGRQSFKNVVTTGTILAADGEKLSKSKKNYTDPYALFDRYGADAFRYYLMSSVIMAAEDLQFRDDDVKEAVNRVVNMLRNTHAFYRLYADDAPKTPLKSLHVLDRWIRARLDALTVEMTDAFDAYDVVRATRPIRAFIEDFSTWYVRRSRDRVKGDDAADKRYALSTMRHVLHTLAHLAAPIMPFVAEEIYLDLKTADEPESVHLAVWPKTETNWFAKLFGAKRADRTLTSDMEEVRRTVSLGLEARQKAGIKVRQPLKQLVVGSGQLAGKDEFLALIADEVNVKEVVVDTTLPSGEVRLDTVLTDALKREGELRDLAREVQDLRKRAGLEPKDKAVLIVPKEREAAVMEHWDELTRIANLAAREAGAELNVRQA